MFGQVSLMFTTVIQNQNHILFEFLTWWANITINVVKRRRLTLSSARDKKRRRRGTSPCTVWSAFSAKRRRPATTSGVLQIIRFFGNFPRPASTSIVASKHSFSSILLPYNMIPVVIESYQDISCIKLIQYIIINIMDWFTILLLYFQSVTFFLYNLRNFAE